MHLPTDTAVNKRDQEEGGKKKPYFYGIYILKCVEGRPMINEIKDLECHTQTSVKTSKVAKGVRPEGDHLGCLSSSSVCS